MDLFGFEKSITTEGFHRSTLIPNLDKTKFFNDLFFWISSLRTQSKNYINIWK